MRGALMIGLVIVLLIIGMLVMKNMGAGTSDNAAHTEAKKHIQHAEEVAEETAQKMGKIKERLQEQ